jgi:hypothetical protein
MVQGKYGSVSYKTKQNKPRPKNLWYIVESVHEPIIDRELWERVQTLVAQRAKPFVLGEIGLFARKARCANCGYTMRSSKNRGKHYLICGSRHVSKDACIGSFIDVDRLEQTVTQELKRLAIEYLDPDEFERNVEFSDNLRVQKAKLETEMIAYQKKITEYAKSVRELYVDKVKGIISEREYVEFSKDFTSEKERLEQLLASCQRENAAIGERAQAGDNRRQLIEPYLNIECLSREIVEKLIDYISVGKRAKGTSEVPIEIHWSF